MDMIHDLGWTAPGTVPALDRRISVGVMALAPDRMGAIRVPARTAGRAGLTTTARRSVAALGSLPQPTVSAAIKQGLAHGSKNNPHRAEGLRPVPSYPPTYQYRLKRLNYLPIRADSTS
jgi:hypothetical protein